MLSQSDVLLDVQNLTKHFPIKKGFFRRIAGYVHAVDDVSFDIKKGETLGLVGESGSGKTTVGRSILRAVDPTGGSVYFNDGENKVAISELDNKALRGMRKKMQMIFQDPFSSLNPRLNIKSIVGEPLIVNGVAKGKALDDRIVELLEQVGLKSEHLHRYPHAFSGGQRQRIGIARALALNPELIIADEPVSALDVSVQAQILNLLQELQEELGLTYLFISHDLGVVRHICHRVGVMYMGKIVEIGDTEELFEQRMHPYAQALLNACPTADPRAPKTRVPLQGEVGDPSNPPTGCRFHPRCPYACEICKKEEPKLKDEGQLGGDASGGHYVACHFPILQ